MQLGLQGSQLVADDDLLPEEEEGRMQETERRDKALCSSLLTREATFSPVQKLAIAVIL